MLIVAQQTLSTHSAEQRTEWADEDEEKRTIQKKKSADLPLLLFLSRSLALSLFLSLGLPPSLSFSMLTVFV